MERSMILLILALGIVWIIGQEFWGTKKPITRLVNLILDGDKK